MMVVVFFYHTVNAQNAVLEDTEQDHTVEVVGQQWPGPSTTPIEDDRR